MSSSKPYRPPRFPSPLKRAPSPADRNLSQTRGATGTAAGNSIDGSRSFMQRWLEPPLQTKPSFQDAGLVRGGVVENMSALGTLPKAAMLKKTSTSTESPPPTSAPGVKRIVLKKTSSHSVAPITAPTSAAGTPSHRRHTPDEAIIISRMDSGITDEEMDLDDSQALSPMSRQLPLTMMDDGDDEDYVPKKTKARRSSQTKHSANGKNPAEHLTPRSNSRRQSHRHKGTRSSPGAVTPAPAASPAKTVLSAAPLQTLDTSPTPTPAPPSPTHSVHSVHSIHSDTSSIRLGREPDDKEQADKAVESAVEEALRHFRYPTAWALRTLYDENSSDPQFVSMIEDVCYQRATPKVLGKFCRLLNDKKKDGKRDNKGFDYFVPPPPGGNLAPEHPETAPYGELLSMDFANILRASVQDFGDEDGHVSKKRKTEPTPQDQQAIAAPALKADDESSIATLGYKPESTRGKTMKAFQERNGQDALSHTHAHPKAHANGSRDNAALATKVKSPHKSPRKSPHKTPKKSTPKRKKTRSDSVSSLSSLSSVPDDAIEDLDDFMDTTIDDEPVMSRVLEDEDAAPNNAQTPVASAQPITAKQTKPAAKKKSTLPKPGSSQNTTANHQPSHSSSRPRDSSMPATTVATSITATTSTPHPTKQPASSVKFNSRFGEFDEDSALLISRKLSTKSETARKTSVVTEESFIREPLELDTLPEDLTLLSQPVPSLPPLETASRFPKTPASALSSRAARAAKRNHDEMEDASSPIVASFRTDLEPHSARGSRAATPAHARSSKKPRGGLRVKTSPIKKKGTSAGIARGVGERPSPVSGGAPHNQDDNDDSCYTCGGNGQLVCCDGCHYSFHFVCIDPPMNEDEVSEEWFCYECNIRYNPPLENNYTGLFASLTYSLDRKNPRSFRLPEDIRERFEGVKTGADGEFEEAVSGAKPKTTKKKEEESFDFLKIRQGDEAVLCHRCHKSADTNRLIVTCSVCGLHWHLDCLDNPLTYPPVQRTWRCPAHVNDMLNDVRASLGPAHKWRPIKNAPVIEQGYSRGLANNGWIDVAWDLDEDEGTESIGRNNLNFGRVSRVSGKGVERDFAERVHRNTNKERKRRLGSSGLANPAPTPAHTLLRSLEEQQAALNIVALSQGDGNRTDQLVNALISEASPSALSLIAQGDATRIAGGDLTSVDSITLETMRKQAEALSQGISKILDARHKNAMAQSKALTPNSISHDDSTMVDDLQLDPASSQDTVSTKDAQETKHTKMQLD
ncbi:hypothetical protein F5Y18DRAFT_210570 [Xylariaceae sp. FL1019]|nr:hypothetical protein F5Y18DRAFT_210570 [Xylariaceae sp. FL1019]